MAIGVYFSPAAMSAAKYDECIATLRQTGAGHPSGRTYHACFGSGDKLSVFDIWTSQASFDKFGKTLMPILTQLGIDIGAPQIVPIHKIITRPKAAPAAKKRSSSKKRGARRSAKKKR
jgi:hypothetical protein